MKAYQYFTFITFLIVIANSCKVSKPRKGTTFDKLTIYYLPQNSTYLTNVACSEIRTMSKTKKIDIVDQKDISSFSQALHTDSNFSFSPNYSSIDARIYAEFWYRDKIVTTYCMTFTKLIFKDSKVYSYNSSIESYLLKFKIMTKFISGS